MGAFGEQIRRRTELQLLVIRARESVQIGERKAAPRRAQNAQPRHAVFAIEQRSGQRQSVDDLGAILQGLQFDGAEGNFRFTERLRNGHKRFARAAKYGDAVFRFLLVGAFPLIFRASGVDVRLMAADQSDDFFCMSLSC